MGRRTGFGVVVVVGDPTRVIVVAVVVLKTAAVGEDCEYSAPRTPGGDVGAGGEAVAVIVLVVTVTVTVAVVVVVVV